MPLADRVVQTVPEPIVSVRCSGAQRSYMRRTHRIPKAQKGSAMSISQLARSIKASPTLKLNETAAVLREKGEPVIHLGGGEPKSRAPIDAIVNCTALLNTGEVRYTPPDGIPAL